MPLTPTQKLHVRQAIADYCKRAEANRLRWHYTQQRPFTGYGVAPDAYHAADCSGYCALAFDWAARKADVHIHSPLDAQPGWGFTGSQYAYLKAHPAPKDKYLVGDMAIFGTASNTVHTSICRKAGTAATSVFSSNGHESWSFGSDAPNPITLADEAAAQRLLGVYRHPALL